MTSTRKVVVKAFFQVRTGDYTDFVLVPGLRPGLLGLSSGEDNTKVTEGSWWEEADLCFVIISRCGCSGLRRAGFPLVLSSHGYRRELLIVGVARESAGHIRRMVAWPAQHNSGQTE